MFPPDLPPSDITLSLNAHRQWKPRPSIFLYRLLHLLLAILFSWASLASGPNYFNLRVFRSWVSLDDTKSRSLEAKLRRKNWLLHMPSSNFHQGCPLVVTEIYFQCKLSKRSSVSLRDKDNIPLNLCGRHRSRRPSRIKRLGPINSSSPPEYNAKWLLASIFNAKTHFAADSNWNDQPIG